MLLQARCKLLAQEGAVAVAQAEAAGCQLYAVEHRHVLSCVCNATSTSDSLSSLHGAC